MSEPRDQIFSYDASGNLLAKTDRVGANSPFGTTYTIASNSNRMTGISNLGIGYAVDAAGNRTADTTTTWVVNARGRVSQVRVISGTTPSSPPRAPFARTQHPAPRRNGTSAVSAPRSAKMRATASGTDSPWL